MAFQYERLVVHSKALEYSVLVQPIIEKIRLHDRDMASQLQRSSNSVPTNIAEGASEDRPKVKADRYRTAKREAEESASDLEKACRLGWVTREEIARCMFLLDEIARMFGADGKPNIDRALLSAKAKDLDATIRKLTAMRDGLKHAAACPAPSHMECPTFRRLLDGVYSRATTASKRRTRLVRR